MKYLFLLFILIAGAASAQTVDTTYRSFSISPDKQILTTTECTVWKQSVDGIIENLTQDSLRFVTEKESAQLRVAEINKMLIRLGKELQNIRSKK